MTTVELLRAAEYEFGAARIVTQLIGMEVRNPTTVLEVLNPAVDVKWRQAAIVYKTGQNGEVRLSPPLHPSDRSDWLRAERLT